MGSVRLTRVSKSYDGGSPVLRELSLEVEDTEFLVLVGPSGCGKSTTLRLIAGLEETTEGTIEIDGAVVNDVAPKDRDIAMVFQNYALYPHMSVRENLAFGLRMRRYPKAEIEARVSEAALILGIQDLLDRKPKALSGGQRQRVALGRAIVRRPKVFLFDEPLSNLDANLRAQMRTEIARLHGRLDATMIYVTHDQVEAMSMGDRIVVMHDGAIQQVDTPMAIYHAPANRFVAGFIGSPAMNFFEGQLRATHDEVRFEELSGAFALPIGGALAQRVRTHSGDALTAGIRPEHLSLDKGGAGALPVRIEVVEPVGNETFIHFSVGEAGGPYVCRTQAATLPRAGETSTLFADTTRLHLFDPETGSAL